MCAAHRRSSACRRFRRSTCAPPADPISTNSSGAPISRCALALPTSDARAHPRSSATWRAFEMAAVSRSAPSPVSARRSRARSAARPSPVRAETSMAASSPRMPGRCAADITLVHHDEPRDVPSVSSSTARLRRQPALAAIEHDQAEIGNLTRLLPRATPSRSTISIASREPRRIDQRDQRALDVDALGDQIARRPGTRVTIARSLPASALNRLDFPTLVRPAMTTVAPSRIIRPRTASPSSSSIRLDDAVDLLRDVSPAR